MTNREFLNAIINSTVADELKTHAENEIAKLDARNAKRSSKPSKTQIANEPLIAQLREILEQAEEPLCSAEIALCMEVTSNKVASLLKKIEGVVVGEKKYNKRKVKSYALGN